MVVGIWREGGPDSKKREGGLRTTWRLDDSGWGGLTGEMHGLERAAKGVLQAGR